MAEWLADASEARAAARWMSASAAQWCESKGLLLQYSCLGYADRDSVQEFPPLLALLKGSPQSWENPRRQSSQNLITGQCQARDQLRSGEGAGTVGRNQTHIYRKKGEGKEGRQGMLLFSFPTPPPPPTPLRQISILCKRDDFETINISV